MCRTNAWSVAGLRVSLHKFRCFKSVQLSKPSNRYTRPLHKPNRRPLQAANGNGDFGNALIIGITFMTCERGKNGENHETCDRAHRALQVWRRAGICCSNLKVRSEICFPILTENQNTAGGVTECKPLFFDAEYPLTSKIGPARRETIGLSKAMSYPISLMNSQK